MKTTTMRSVTGLLLSIIVNACGPSSDQVTLTVIPFVSSEQKMFPDLSRELLSSNFLNVNDGTSCRQAELLVAINTEPKPEGQGDPGVSEFLSFPVILHSNISASVSEMHAWLNTQSTTETIQLLAPRGKTVEVGLVGAVYSPVDNLSENGRQITGTTPDGICDRLVTSTRAASSYGVIGHTKINTQSNSVLALNTWVIESNPINAWTIPTVTNGSVDNNGSFNCPDPTRNDQCSYRDQVEIKSLGSPKPIVYAVEYFYSKNSGPVIRHNLKSVNSDSAEKFIVPSIFPMTVIYALNDGAARQTIKVFKSGDYTVAAGAVITFTELGRN